MKKIFLFLFLLMPLMVKAQTGVLSLPYQRLRQAYKGDSCEQMFSGDSLKFRTSKKLFKFNRPAFLDSINLGGKWFSNKTQFGGGSTSYASNGLVKDGDTIKIGNSVLNSPFQWNDPSNLGFQYLNLQLDTDANNSWLDFYLWNTSSNKWVESYADLNSNYLFGSKAWVNGTKSNSAQIGVNFDPSEGSDSTWYPYMRYSKTQGLNNPVYTVKLDSLGLRYDERINYIKYPSMDTTSFATLGYVNYVSKTPKLRFTNGIVNKNGTVSLGDTIKTDVTIFSPKDKETGIYLQEYTQDSQPDNWYTHLTPMRLEGGAVTNVGTTFGSFQFNSDGSFSVQNNNIDNTVSTTMGFQNQYIYIKGIVGSDTTMFKITNGLWNLNYTNAKLGVSSNDSTIHFTTPARPKIFSNNSLIDKQFGDEHYISRDITEFKLSSLSQAPSSATDTGETGEIRITSGYIYVCVASNTWVRSALTTW